MAKQESLKEDNYILITPLKNEEKNIKSLVASVISQEKQPKLWLIVNDGSTDNSLNLLNKHIKKYIKKYKKNLIVIYNLKSSKRDLGKHYAIVCNYGFKKALNYCKEKKIKFQYIGLLDADIILPKDYYSRLIKEFKKNPKLGIASGNLGEIEKNKTKFYNLPDDLVCGAARLWKKECFFETKGYLNEPSPDTISNTLAILKGWHIKRFKHIKMLQTRKPASYEGLLKGYYDFGKRYYYIGFNPIRAFLKTIKHILNLEFYGVSFFVGYISSFILNEKKLHIKEVRDYYWRKIW